MVAARLTRFDPKRNWRRSESSPIRSLIRASKLVAPAPLGTMTLTEMGYARSNTRSVCFGFNVNRRLVFDCRAVALSNFGAIERYDAAGQLQPYAVTRLNLVIGVLTGPRFISSVRR
jgi:hypothetical protein